MKNFFTLVILICVAAAAAYYFNPKAKKYIDDLFVEKYKIKETIQKTTGDAETTAYKWRNDLGVWQLTQTPPPEGTPYEEVKVRSDTNVIPGIERDNAIFD